MDTEISEVLNGIGPRQRALRRSRGRTLAELSRLTGLSISLLSRLETGRRQPTLDALLPLARAHRVSLDHLIGAPETGDPRVHLQPQRSSSGGVVVPLTRAPSRIRVFKHVLGPREPRLVAHVGHAWLYVLSGRLRLLLGDEGHLLAPGETAEFDSATPHWFGPVDEAVEILHIFGPLGEAAVSRVDQVPAGETGTAEDAGAAGDTGAAGDACTAY